MESLLLRFLDSLKPMEEKLGPILIQIPPEIERIIPFLRPSWKRFRM